MQERHGLSFIMSSHKNTHQVSPPFTIVTYAFITFRIPRVEGILELLRGQRSPSQSISIVIILLSEYVTSIRNTKNIHVIQTL